MRSMADLTADIAVGVCGEVVQVKVWSFGAATKIRGARRSSRLQGKAASPIFRLKEELVGMIVGLSRAWPAGRAGREEGLVRLLGCVAAPKRNKGSPHSKP